METADRILELKQEIAGDRDLLQKLSRFLRAKIASLQDAYKKKPYRALWKKIKEYRIVAGSVLQSISAANAMLDYKSDYRIFGRIFRFLAEKLTTIRRSSTFFAGKFRGIHDLCDGLLLNTLALRTIVSN